MVRRPCQKGYWDLGETGHAECGTDALGSTSRRRGQRAPLAGAMAPDTPNGTPVSGARAFLPTLWPGRPPFGGLGGALRAVGCVPVPDLFV